MNAAASLLALCLLSEAVHGAPKPAVEALVAARAVLSSLESAPVRDVVLQDRVFRVGLGSFSGEAALSNGTLRSVASLRAINLTPSEGSLIRANLLLSRLSIRYNANVTFGARTEAAEMDVEVDSLELVVELSHDGQLDLQSVEALEMDEMRVNFRGLRVFLAQSELLSLLFRGAFRFDIEDEVVAVFEELLRELVDAYNVNNL
ncbi:uncharacterized protein LOC144112474 [Amblyomma americanum]|uniref:Secreted protein n=1 Tax=Amblyomma americanum TaxID=6943 RepID=A0AAQ4DS20_AMBAM